jgi:hypothetical protein
MGKENRKHQYLPCPYGCITKRGAPTMHRGENNCQRLRKARIQQMNLSRNSIH